MAGNKYIVNNGGRYDEARANQASAGVADAGKIVALNASGQIDSTMMPTVKGRSTLVAGAVTVTTSAAASAMIVQVTNVNPSATIGTLYVTNIVPGVSFDIRSTSSADTSTVAWAIL